LASNLRVTQVSLSIPKDLLARIDEKRGIATRSAFIVDILKKHLEAEEIREEAVEPRRAVIQPRLKKAW